jgi:hypothetical protein
MAWLKKRKNNKQGKGWELQVLKAEPGDTIVNGGSRYRVANDNNRVYIDHYGPVGNGDELGWYYVTSTTKDTIEKVARLSTDIFRDADC